MSQLAGSHSCPCGSGRALSACCGLYLEGHADAPTAEALMRSRYTAFVLRRAGYLSDTWDPAQRPRRLELDKDPTEWLGLEILRTEAGCEDDSEGRVEFIARFRGPGSTKAQSLHEDSRFRRVAGRWLYIDGEIDPGRAPAVRAAQTPGRNDPCPCQSGQKYKRCCGK